MYIHGYYRQDFEQIKRNFNMDNLKDKSEYAYKHISWLEENISTIRRYLQELNTQAQLVLNTTFRYEVYYERYHNYDNKIFYYVGVRHLPVDMTYEEIRDKDIQCQTLDCQRFKGIDRKQAKEYAKELAKKYHCEIKLKGVDKL